MELLTKCPNCYNNSEPYEISEIVIGGIKFSTITCPCCGKSYIADEVIKTLNDVLTENNDLKTQIEELEEKICRMKDIGPITDKEIDLYVNEQISRATNPDE